MNTKPTMLNQPPQADYGAVPPRVSKLLARIEPQFRVSAQQAAAIVSYLTPLGLPETILEAGAAAPLLKSCAIDLSLCEATIGHESARLAETIANLPRPHNTAREALESDNVLQAESLRQLFLSLIQDLRAVPPLLAWLLTDLIALRQAPLEERRLAAEEIFVVYAPIANRLGIWQLKWQLEDMAFRLRQPHLYAQIASALAARRQEREARLQRGQNELAHLLNEAGIAAQIQGRPKHIFSIYRKMQRKNVPLESLYDLLALRILVADVPTCYAALSVIQSHFEIVPGEFDDYIAAPKQNRYQSLHTAVRAADQQALEIQIRTFSMHHYAEYGVAAHWRYKEGQQGNAASNDQINWLRQLLSEVSSSDHPPMPSNQTSPAQTTRQVYALTPKGRIIPLAKGATPLDFAYHVHTEVGHRTRGARVNARMVPLTYPLRTGDVVEIVTGKTANPKRDWLRPKTGYLATKRARSKVNLWFRAHHREQRLDAGRNRVESAIGQLGVPRDAISLAARRLGFSKPEALFLAVGSGSIRLARLRRALYPEGRRPPANPSKGKPSAPDIVVGGVKELLTARAGCCGPEVGDPIAAFVTRRHGIRIHRKDCPAFLAQAHYAPEQVLSASWRDACPAPPTPAVIRVTTQPSSAHLDTITATLKKAGLTVTKMDAQFGGQETLLWIQLDSNTEADLQSAIQTLNQLSGVVAATLA